MSCRQSFFIVSIDLEPRTNTTSLQHQKEVRSAGLDLMRLFDKHGVPATWAMAKPGRDAKTDSLLASKVDHEIAMQGDAVWYGNSVSRAELTAHLSESIGRAAELDVSLHSIVGLKISEKQTDLLVKHSISGMRSPCGGNGRTVQWVQPEQIRFGVWDFPESYRFPGPKTWLSDITRVSVERYVKTAAARNQPLHLAVDAERVATTKASALATLEGILACATNYRSMAQLQTVTLAEYIRQKTARPQIRSTQSILRVA